MSTQWRQHVKYLYFKVLTLFCLLPPTLQFTTSLWSCPEYYISLLLTVLDIIYSSSNIAKHGSLYVTNGLSAGCFCTVCRGWKCGRKRMWLVSMQAVSIATKINHTDVYHHDINYNCLYFITLYLKQTLLPIRSLAKCTLERNAKNTHIMCITGVNLFGKVLYMFPCFGHVHCSNPNAAAERRSFSHFKCPCLHPCGTTSSLSAL